jgi:hypothetical protein
MAKVVVHVFFTTTNGDKNYENFRLMFSAGKQDAGPGYVGTIASPVPVTNVTLPPDLPDPAFFSYPFSVAEKAFVRGILAKIRSEGGVVPSTCTLELLSLPEPASDEWKHLSAGDITLKYCPDSSNPTVFEDLLTDPQAFASVGDILVGIDHDRLLLPVLGNSELAGKSGDYVPKRKPHDMSVFLNDVDDDDEETIRGRAIISLGRKLFPLFLDYILIDPETNEVEHAAGIIARVKVLGRALDNDIKAYVGMNPQEVCPGMDRDEIESEDEAENEIGDEDEDENENGDVMLFVPCIGGDQKTDDGDTIATNGTYSNICVVPAKGAWPDFAAILLTGDPNEDVGLATAYDIHDLGVIFRNRASLFFILTVMYGGVSYNRLYFRIYRSTVGKMLDLLNPPPDPNAGSDGPHERIPPTLSEAVASGALEVIDEGEIVSDEYEPAGLYHPSINVIQHPDDPEKDLVVVCTGSTILVTRAMAYGSPTAKNAPVPPVPPETESGVTEPDPEPPYSRGNPYTLFGNNGGVNMNSFDLTIETLYQAMRGKLSLKHGVRMSRAPFAAKVAAAVARLGTGAPPAAPAAPATPAAPVAPAAGEDEEK